MLPWHELARLTDPHLARLDVAALNLECARGLPDSGDIPSAECLDRLDHYARCVGHYTEQRLPEFRREPDVYDDSVAIFRVVCLMRLLQQVFGVRYNPAKVKEEARFTTADVFVHGALVGEGGTCASLPVVYAAVGRRLGYPLRLVSAPHHRFVRWDDPHGERFNIEINATGLNCPSDDDYRNGSYPFGPTEARDGCFLRSQTPRQELAGFLAERGFRWLDYEEHRQAAECFVWACHLAPDNLGMLRRASSVLQEWEDRVRARMPVTSPRIVVRFPDRRYRAVPETIERRMIFWEAIEKLLAEDIFRRMCRGLAPSGKRPIIQVIVSD